ncbi:MAG: AMP-binding protein, partial [Chloroflexota bacterium]
MRANNLAELVSQLENLGDRELFRHRTEFRTFSWSYRRVARTAGRVVRFLRQEGLTQGDRVMIWAPNSPEWAVVFLGCVLGGFVPVPIDLRFRPPFLKDVQRQTGARLAFTSQLREELELGIPTLPLEELEERLEKIPPGDVEPARVAEDDLVEILYTSGTTAEPKGVMLTHRNLLSELESFQPIVPPEPEYRFLSVLPLSHIFEQMGGLFLPMSRGGTVVYIGVIRPSTLMRALEKDQPNAMMVVPRFLELLRDRGIREWKRGAISRGLLSLLLYIAPHLPFEIRRRLFAPVHRQLGGHLKYLVSGGAALDPALERFWDSTGIVVLQGYGLTETSSAVTCNRVEERRIGSVGKPLPNQEVRLAPDGEILVKGPNVTPGYYKKPELTASTLVDGWLKTGDIGSFDPEGYLFIRGRKKDVIVTSAGLNIYPEDVERVLSAVPGVRDSAVVEWRGDVHGVLLLEPEVDPEQVVQEANAKLDESQKIHGYTVWPQPDFPRTPTMKVRKASVLEFLEGKRSKNRASALAAVGTPTVKQLVAETAKVSPGELADTTELGVDLGLSSIDLLELVLTVEQEMGIDLPEEDLTAETTLGQLEKLVQKGEAGVREAKPSWLVTSKPTRLLRHIFQKFLLFPPMSALVPLRVEGQENVRFLQTPCLLAANHSSMLDTPTILRALPENQRARTITAAWAEYFQAAGLPPGERAFRRLQYYLAAAFIGIFPLPQTRLIRSSLRLAGELIDRGWNVLIFPEGTRTRTGEMEPFKEGVGVMASRLKVPVVPVRVDGLFDILPAGKLLPKRGQVTVRFGPPML